MARGPWLIYVQMVRIAKILSCVVALRLASGGLAGAQASDVAVSWDKALVYLPGHSEPITPAEIPAGQRQPTLLYMHGCGGLNQENDRPWAKYIASLGLIVVAPDRFARADKRSSCWPDRNPAVHEMRREELLYGLQQIAASSWADPANIFVMGFSEGADTVAQTPFTGVRAVILSSWTCQRVTELAVPSGIPVLSIMWDQRSRWKFWDRGDMDCLERFAQRQGFETAALHGRGHATYGKTAARGAVAQFLREHLAHRSAERKG